MVIKRIISFSAIILGALLASFSVACILIPNEAIDYGTAGVAIIISKFTGFSLPICVLCVFLPFLILGGFYLGKIFFFKAAVGSAAYMAGIALFERIPFELNTEHYLAVVFGGAILGVGLSIILRLGGCIDGSEILANIIIKFISEKFGKTYSMTGFLIGFNACVYFVVFIFMDRDSALASLLVYVVATVVIDHFTDRFEAVKQVKIITKNPEVIANKIRKDLHKTCTIMDSYGMINGENKTLICYVNYLELQQLREHIKDYEEAAFVTVSTIDEIIK